jgi:hypothetical protein
MMNTKLQQSSIDLQDRIFKEHYYVHVYGHILENLNLTTAQILSNEVDDTTLWDMWNDFYFALPDSPAIRFGPFFKLCDICENPPVDDVILNKRLELHELAKQAGFDVELIGDRYHIGFGDNSDDVEPNLLKFANLLINEFSLKGSEDGN